MLRELGSGGQAAVYLAREELTGRMVALKQLRLRQGSRKRARLEALFEREYHTLVRLKHPCIIEVYDYGLTSDGPYYTMELLEGQDLKQLAPLPYRQACAVLRDVASSLALIHAHRLVHRDVSTRNVCLAQNGRAKLIDFGALASFGVAPDIIGTPSFMAPEVFGRAPLDQRTDLFALGAVGYWALCGQPAYSAQNIHDLPELWRHTPTPPTQLVPGLPPAFETLILSLLNLDPLARPMSAADVIDQLTAIGGLPPEELEQATQSYLLSSRMVGREKERNWFAKRLQRALDGKGAEIVVEAAAGLGKTRLLHELSLDAQLRGVTTLKADAQANPGAYGVAGQLAQQLVRACPELARKKAAPYAGLLGHLSRNLKLALQVQELLPLSEEPIERHARLQNALHEWFMAVAREQRLLLAVDNGDSLDERSAGFLAALAHEGLAHGVLLLVALRADTVRVADRTLGALRKPGNLLVLGCLPVASCEELVLSLFGEIANIGRIARLFHEQSGGNPQHCMELAQFLVHKGIVKYIAGGWVLPLEIAGHELPRRSEDFLAARLVLLSATARKLAETLSIHSKPVSIERCRAHARGLGEAELYAALAELVAQEIVVVEGSYYRFLQPAIRDGLAASLEPGRRRELHVQAAEWLLETGDQEVGVRVDAGWHLLQAGDEARGADILAHAGRDFARSEFARESTEQVVQALEAAFAVYERQGRSDHELAGILFSLVPLSFPLDRRISLALGERAFQLGLRITGLQFAHELRPKLGRHLALSLGLTRAGLAFLRPRRRPLGYDLPAAVAACYAVFAATLGAYSLCQETSAAERMVEMARPLRLFGDKHLATLIYDSACAYLRLHRGGEHQARVLLEGYERQFREPALKRTIGEQQWKFLDGALLSTIGTLYSYEFGSRALEVATEMEQLGFRSWKMSALQVRLLHHAMRGESETARHYGDQAELFAVQGNPTWQTDMVVPPTLVEPEFQARDTVGMRRLLEQVTRQAEKVPASQPYADATHAAYLTLRGELDAALALFERMLPRLAFRQAVGWSTIRGWYASALNAAGHHQRAKQLALEVVSVHTSHQLRIRLDTVSMRCQLALAELGLGRHAEAAAVLDACLMDCGHHDQPLYVGLLHRTRAQVALAAGEPETFKTHLQETERRFRGTRNPALVAQWERLAEQGVRSGLIEPVTGSYPLPAIEPHAQSIWAWECALNDLAEATDPCEHALQMLVEQAGARHGYLYTFDGERMQLLVATSPEEPPRDCELHLQRAAASVRTLSNRRGQGNCVAAHACEAIVVAAEPETTAVASPAAKQWQTRYRVALLSSGQADEPPVAGGVILENEHGSQRDLNADLLPIIARLLSARTQT